MTPTARRAPTDKYVLQAFVSFAVGSLSFGLAKGSGIYIPAYRFVNPLTGQMTEWMVLDEITV